jgi:cob(I)alamin adenosyltransferase
LCSERRYKVYTKTGDKGSSSLYNGERRDKDDDFFMALGDTDELNATIGLAREYCAVAGVGITDQLVQLQSRLLDVGSSIATPIKTSSAEQLARVTFPAEITPQIEQWIDAMDEKLPPLKNFILPVSTGPSFDLLALRDER